MKNPDKPEAQITRVDRIDNAALVEFADGDVRKYPSALLESVKDEAESFQQIGNPKDLPIQE